jgi:iron complex outermembrane receptor protein
VINVISRPAAETQGTLLETSAGTGDRYSAAVRQGGRVQGGHYRVYGLFHRDGALRLADGGSARDGTRIGQAGARFDVAAGGGATLTLQGDAYAGRESQPVGDPITVRGGNLLGRWERPTVSGGRSQWQVYYDRVERTIPGVFAERRDTFDAQGQAERRHGAHTFLAGLRARLSADRIRNSASILFLPAQRTTRIVSAFAQDQMALPDDRWRLIAGTTLEYNSFTGFEAQPSVRTTFMASETMMGWAAISRAVRTPSRIDTDFVYRIPTGATAITGNPDFRSETLLTAEAGWRWRPRAAFFADVATFVSRYEQLRSQEPIGAAPVPVTLRNELGARVAGAEATLTWQPAAWSRWKLGWRELSRRFVPGRGSRDATGGAAEGNDPRRIALLRACFDLPQGFQVDVVLRHTGARPNPAVPAVWGADVRIAREFGRGWSWALQGSNLLDRAQREFGAAGPATPEVERSFNVSLSWQR